MNTTVSTPDTLAPETWKRFLSWTGARTILYWIFTLPVAFEMTAGGVWDLLWIEFVRVTLAHLGYPPYLLTILGIWKIPCALALLIPRFPRLKEWAYAGAFFTYSGAVASHFAVGDGAELLSPPLVLAVFTLASWVLRPANRSFAPAQLQKKTKTGILAWAVPIVIVAVFLILSFLTLPEGPPPALKDSQTFLEQRRARRCLNRIQIFDKQRLVIGSSRRLSTGKILEAV